MASERELIGFCEFRRTWCNNIVFDYLGVHPELLTVQRPISGVGTALLYGLSIVAKQLDSRIVWAETTDTSAGFYSGIFGLDSPSDLIRIPFSVFHARLSSAVEKGRN